MPSFGAKLKQQREQRGISLDEISGSTKISTRMLHALEEDHFDQLPGGIFNKGFIRAYARVLGMDEDEVIADYLAAITPPEKEPKLAVEEPLPDFRAPEVGNQAASLPWEAFAVVLLVVGIGFAVWGYHSRARAKSRTSAASHEPAQSLPVSAGIPIPIKPSQTVPAKSSAPALSLHINVRSDCWISIKADGHEVLRGTVTAPTEKSIPANKQIVVRAGDISVLDFEFNGKKLSPQGEEGEVKTLIFDAKGWREVVPPPPTPPVQEPPQPPPTTAPTQTP